MADFKLFRVWPITGVAYTAQRTCKNRSQCWHSASAKCTVLSHQQDRRIAVEPYLPGVALNFDGAGFRKRKKRIASPRAPFLWPEALSCSVTRFEKPKLRRTESERASAILGCIVNKMHIICARIDR